MTTQLLTFSLDNSTYAFNVFKVQEVLPYEKPVQMPCSSTFIEGIIKSRDKGITVIDLRKKFNLPSVEPTETSKIIVVEILCPKDDDPNHISTFGAIVDNVLEVIEIDNNTLEPTPKFGNTISCEYINGLTKHNENFIIILDEQKIFSAIES